jgi:hypothetical protein
MPGIAGLSTKYGRTSESLGFFKEFSLRITAMLDKGFL